MTVSRIAAGASVVAAGLATAGAITVSMTGPALPGATLAGWVGEHGLILAALLYTVVGGVIVWRQPANRIGLLMIAIGLSGTLGGLAEAVVEGALVHGRSLPGATLAGWVGEWYWLPWLWGQLVLLPALFPTGQPASPRWRWMVRAAMSIAVASTLAAMFAQEILLDVDGVEGAIRLDNPLGVLPLSNFEEGPTAALLLLVPILGIAAVVSLVTRFRRAPDVERRQITWVVYGLAFTIVGFTVGVTLDTVATAGPAVLESLLLLVVPTTVGIAVTRYRLYDIDRIVSRTVSYALVTGVLVGIYALGVLGVGALVPGERSDLLVAGSTLVVAALFRPVRSRFQAIVDRRFNRARYDAAHTLEAFSSRLRDEVDIDSLVHQLEATVRVSFGPRGISTWTRAMPGGVKP